MLNKSFTAASKAIAKRIAVAGIAASSLAGCVTVPAGTPIFTSVPCGPAVTARGQQLYDANGRPVRTTCIWTDPQGQHTHVVPGGAY